MRAALIIFDDDDPDVSILGVPWPEFRMRNAIRAGATHVVVVPGRVTARIVAAIDRAKSDGVSVALARTAMETADLFHPEEAVLLLSGAAIVDDDVIAKLMAADRPTLVCVAADSDPAWELIDARSRWTGFARFDGEQVRATAAMVGDWNLGSTLLRQAVAARAKRLVLGDGDALLRADRPVELAIAEQRIVSGAGHHADGWASRFILAPVAGLAGRLSGRWLADVARFSPWFALVPLVPAVLFSWWKWPVLAAAMLLLGFMLEAFGALAERATGREVKWPRERRHVLHGATVAAGAGLVLPLQVDRGPLVAVVMLVFLASLAARLQDPRKDPWWRADVPGYVVTVGFLSIFGPQGTALGLAAALMHAGVSLFLLQNRLSRPLT